MHRTFSLDPRTRQKAGSNPIFLAFVFLFWGISILLFRSTDTLRPTLRWMLWSKQYRAQLRAQPAPDKGELPNVEWDGWGWAGMDTDVYLVFDEKDTLREALKTHQSGKSPGIPCDVARVQRLEKSWYSVTFYTGSYW
ncbi:MAG: hypothetical protein P4L03_07840 [Terracidiphilus sp.]|nr:hypothetical protein [Terracidiphilus sp.]